MHVKLEFKIKVSWILSESGVFINGKVGEHSTHSVCERSELHQDSEVAQAGRHFRGFKEEQQALWGSKSLKNHSLWNITARQNIAHTLKDEADVSHSPYHIIVLVDYSVA